MKRPWFFLVCCLLLTALGSPPAVRAITSTTATVHCDPVLTYTDGTPILFEDTIGYKFVWGTFPHYYTNEVDAGFDMTSAVLTGLVPGTTYYIAAVADSAWFGTESAYSAELVYFHAGAAPWVPVFRFLNIKNWTYLFTIDLAERDYYIDRQSRTWKYEGEKFRVHAIAAPGTVPVYRFLNKKNWTYFFTIDQTERNYYISNFSKTWAYEGEKFYVYPDPSQPGLVPVYRFLNKVNWSYMFTTNEAEKNYYIVYQSGTWQFEGIEFYVSESPQ